MLGAEGESSTAGASAFSPSGLGAISVTDSAWGNATASGAPSADVVVLALPVFAIDNRVKGSDFPPNIKLPRLENDRLLKSSQSESSGMEVVMGTNSDSAAWGCFEASSSSSAVEGRAERGGGCSSALGEPRVAGSCDVTLSMSFVLARSRLSTLSVFFLSLLFPVERMLKVLPSPNRFVIEDARVGVDEGSGFMGDSTRGCNGELVEDVRVMTGSRRGAGASTTSEVGEGESAGP